MGFLNKVMFWKKEDAFDFDKLAEDTMKKEEMEGQGHWGMEQTPLGSPDRPLFPQDGQESQPFRPTSPSFSSNSPSSFTQQSQGSSPLGGVQLSGSPRELELINSKLDTIKAMLGSIEGRLTLLEAEKKDQKRLW